MSVTADSANTQAQHFMIYKPYGFLSQFVAERRKRKPILSELGEFPAGIMAIGRLDHDSEGLLLLTTDGKTSHRIRSKSIEKEYYVQLDGEITDQAMARLCEGVEIAIKGEKYSTQPCKVTRLVNPPLLPPRGRKIRDARHGPTSWVAITRPRSTVTRALPSPAKGLGKKTWAVSPAR